MDAAAEVPSGPTRVRAEARGRFPRALRVGDRVASGVCVTALIVMAALLLGLAAGYRPLVDHSDSMRPAIRAGDLLFTRAEPAGRIRRGDIVSFKDPALAGKLITHRVVAIHADGARIGFLTKGDANAAPESWSVPRGASVGRLSVRVPEIGRMVAWMSDPLVRTVLLTLAALLLSTALLRRMLESVIGRPLARAAASVLALGVLVSVTLRGTVSAYVDTTTTASNGFAAAADSIAPTAVSETVGRSTAYDTGFIKQGASYYVYANVTDTGNPASGIASVTADVHTMTSGTTAAVLAAGSFTAGGVAYNRRSAAITAATPSAAGSDAYSLTSTDSAGNARTQSFTTTIDNTAPTATDVQSTNVSGGTVGHLDKGDTLKLTYSGTMDPYSILAGWTGVATNVQVALVDGGGTSPDSIYVYDTAASPNQVPVGIVTLGSGSYLGTGAGNYITYGAVGSATPSTMTRAGSLITIVLGTASATSLTSSTASAMTWTPTTSATDIAGNAVTGAAATESGTVHVNF